MSDVNTLQVKKAAILNDLFVAPVMRGQKVGERLFPNMFVLYTKHDFAYMTWETAKDNLVLNRCMRRWGTTLQLAAV
ncbi:N-acetyltransferase [Effusibacillus dendaii]|uniref:N-acetyltransferase domain-containing protein n=1 Tax=Effusibacillus dendaii TaxID=2743772 RepID=A0A7I8DA60_9BACL|nr:hypothetical protein [Effusibacillus dendaii]BCJ87073.1 hypothetical protein skT53_20580 [Effusibacillus dendaii]